MNIRAIPITSLTPGQLALWDEVQRDNPALASPFFRPEFAKSCAAVGRPVEVALVEQRGKAVGFLPFERRALNIGAPVGGRLSDFQAVIAPADVSVYLPRAASDCGLSALVFDHWLATQPTPGGVVWEEDESPYIDVSRGFDEYAACFTGNRRHLRDPLRKRDRLEREVGPLRFAPHVPHEGVLQTLFQWKWEQYRKTQLPSICEYEWVRALLATLLHFRDERFTPCLSVLRAGERIVAIHYFLRSGPVLHGWFCAYDPAMGRYSPGILLLLEMLKRAPELGIARVDLGKGSERFKRNYMTGAQRVATGGVYLRDALHLGQSAYRRVRRELRHSVLGAALRTPMRQLHKMRVWVEMQ